MTAAPSTTPDWRSSLLPRLPGLPLLPVGAGDSGKAPVDVQTGLAATGWQRARWEPGAIARTDPAVVTAVGMRCGPDAGGLLVLDLDGQSALEAAAAAGCDLNDAGWVITRPTAPDRCKVVFRVPREQWPATDTRRAGKVVHPTGNGEQVEAFWSKGQVVVAGLHRPSGAFLEWRGGPEQITDLPPAWLAFWQSLEPAPVAPQRPAAPAPAVPHLPGDPAPLLELLPRDLEALARNGCSEGGRNDACFRLAAGALATAEGAAAAGLPVAGTVEDLVLTFASACNPPLAWREAAACLRSAESEPRTPDPGLAERIAYQQRQRARGEGAAPAPRSGATGVAAAAAPAPQPRKTRPSPQQKLTALRELAADLLEQRTPFADRVPLLRARAEDLELTLRDDELRRLIWDARRAASGADEILGPGAALDLTPTRWCWEGIVMPAALNLLIALPKVGKTSLVLAMLAAWHRGEPTFLGLPLVGTCPPVLIVGTDQPQSDWGRMLLEVGLIEADGVIRAPLVGLAHAGRPLHLSQEGIERIATYAAAHPGLFVLVDSIAAVTGPLGIDENSAELAEPIRDLMEAVEPHGATVLAIHHASKGRAGESPTLASRGSTALPAVASQIVNLARMASGNPGAPPDRRIVVKTDGRAGEPQHLLVERTADGWISHGSAESVALAQHLQKIEEDLNDRQADALEVVRERWASGQRTEAKGLAEALQLAKDGERKARSTLDQLARKGLLRSATEVGLQGRTKWFWPIAAEGQEGDRRPSRGGISQPSEPSEPSYPPTDQIATPISWRDGKEGKEGKEGQESTPRETLRTPSAPAAAPDRVDPSATVRTSTDLVERALLELKLAPHPANVDAVSSWLKGHAPGVSRRQVAEAIERLRQQEVEQPDLLAPGA